MLGRETTDIVYVVAQSALLLLSIHTAFFPFNHIHASASSFPLPAQLKHLPNTHTTNMSHMVSKKLQLGLFRGRKRSNNQETQGSNKVNKILYTHPPETSLIPQLNPNPE
ncbi:hypothetical protein KIL84_008243 [Mauremys mutica]|uniref:Uncharacterized protein n=1 Tax=Mauremys mutica TaxID=74926 RepID=A0A9D3X7L6_9SAUR|nr:hypothetical protein KIL84_008243 [Mauremys mutica]